MDKLNIQTIQITSIVPATRKDGSEVKGSNVGRGGQMNEWQLFTVTDSDNKKWGILDNLLSGISEGDVVDLIFTKTPKPNSKFFDIKVKSVKKAGVAPLGGEKPVVAPNLGNNGVIINSSGVVRGVSNDPVLETKLDAILAGISDIKELLKKELPF